MIGSAWARPLQEAGPIACTMSASGKARVTSPAPQRRLRSSERHRRGEMDRVDCVRIVHKTVNVLNKLPKSLQAKAKRALQDIWMAETKKDALAAFDAFVETYGVKYDKAVACLAKDRDALLAFYDFPPSTGSTYGPRTQSRARSRRSAIARCAKGCLSNKTALAMVFKL